MNRYKITTKQSEIVTGTSPGKLIFDKPKDKARENLFLGKVENRGPLTYSQPITGKQVEFLEMGQDTSRKVNSLEQTRDDNGFTHPNLHRRIDAKVPENVEEVTPREYRLQINGKHSYRHTHIVTHLDYTDLKKYESSEYYEEIAARLAECEKREIP